MFLYKKSSKRYTQNVNTDCFWVQVAIFLLAYLYFLNFSIINMLCFGNKKSQLMSSI